jgi:ATP-dependent 26S proteasome regulatory subunit
VQNGWTFISAKPGRDKIEDVLRTAKLYQPAVVFVEDIDGEASSGENQDVTRLLEAFDGISGKGGELMILMTTNHIDRIHKGMLRPGRLDAVVEVAALDRNGIEKLIKAIVQPGKLAADVNYDEVAEAMTDFLPAFIRETITRAVSFSIARNGGSSEYVIDTPDLCNAAHSLRPQLDHLDKAGEGNKRPSVDGAIEKVVKTAVASFALDARGGERLREFDAESGEFVAAE